MNVKRQLSNWLLELTNYNTPNIDALPNIDLYMEQMINYLENELRVFMKNENDKIITSSMINNYVKANIIPAPNAKKYRKNHLCNILEICSLKQVLQLSDIYELLNYDEYKSVFVHYKDQQDKLIQSIACSTRKELVNVKKETAEEDLKKLATKMAIQANIYKTISERILYLLDMSKQEEIEKIRKLTIKKS